MRRPYRWRHRLAIACYGLFAVAMVAGKMLGAEALFVVGGVGLCVSFLIV